MSHIRAYQPADRPALYDVCVRTANAGGDARGIFSHDHLWGDVWAVPYAERHPDLAWVVESDDKRVIGYIVATDNTDAFETWFRDEWWPTRAPAYSKGVPDARGAAGDGGGAGVGRAGADVGDDSGAGGAGPDAGGGAGVGDDSDAGGAGAGVGGGAGVRGSDPEREQRVIAMAAHRGPGQEPFAAEYPAHLHIDLLPETQGQGLGRKLMDTLTAELRRRGVAGLHLGMDPANKGAAVFYERLGFDRLPTSDGSLKYGLRL
ncbi:GNAT family N-acetyltransferase [Microbacterium sp. YY-01]|uniref:GNAT family N-acetyltransferase n=1 Tax=Microbacterium sp. YY-01 TaxID=3421634 RepID=UPI003D171DD8